MTPSYVAHLYQLLQQRSETIAFAESCTGGALAALFTEIPGASHCFLGSAVVYCDLLKDRWLGVPQQLLQQHGAVSAACVRVMAEHVQQSSGAHWGVAVSGWLGPEGGDQHASLGTVWMGWHHQTGEGGEEVIHLQGTRDQNRQAVCEWVYTRLSAVVSALPRSS